MNIAVFEFIVSVANFYAIVYHILRASHKLMP